MIWYQAVKKQLDASGLFTRCTLIGAKLRALITETLFLDIYYDPATKSYSYGLIDLELPYKGDKRIFGWDDYPHEGVEELKQLKSYPHHFQVRKNGQWVFEESPMRGDITKEIEFVIQTIANYRKHRTTD